MTRANSTAKRLQQRGSTLIEVMVSVVLFSIGIIGLIRVLGVAVTDSGAIGYRSVASTIADEIIGRMWVDRANLAGYVGTNLPVPELPSGTRTVTVDNTSPARQIVTVTVRWQPPGSSVVSNHQISATIASN
jgi:type IV pilus assembly protein PilV